MGRLLESGPVNTDRDTVGAGEWTHCCQFDCYLYTNERIKRGYNPVIKTFKQFVSEQPRDKAIQHTHDGGDVLSWANCAVGEYFRQVLFIDLNENEPIANDLAPPDELIDEIKSVVDCNDTYNLLVYGDLETYGDVLDSLNGDY